MSEPLDSAAKAILHGNDKGGYTVPTAGLYPYQWNWDSMFAAWGFSTFDIPRAWEEVETLFTGQWPSGMVPHILFHRPDPGYFPGPDVWGCDGPVPSSGISQPPVAATFIRKIWEQDPEAGRAHIERLVPQLADWHRWFMAWRTDRGAVFITHPWEAGRDNAPDWDNAMARIDPVGVGEYQRRDTAHVDASMRPTKEDYDRYIWLVQRGRRLGWDDAKMAEDPPFRVADPGMTFILLRANRDLEALAAEVGHPTDEIADWTRVLEDGAETLWNEELGCYDSRDAVHGGWGESLSNASFLCWYGGVDRPEMLRQLDRVMSKARYGVASYDPDGAKFDSKRYWRGPIWGIMNTLIGLGLSQCGHEEQARRVKATTRALIEDHGFAEYFDPLNGAPAGGGRFTWTAAIWLAWAGRE
ncbi:MGH1-like glycoside hydrolase domain-containing protein [Aestuariibius sp. 2305UL40-4]|uniref:MGH1-like glycoside hydrolase domain-containing protein n=1 Tax=Aestuariibius violaceus TaxID=3234132 RepID=UPI00345E4BDA